MSARWSKHLFYEILQKSTIVYLIDMARKLKFAAIWSSARGELTRAGCGYPH